MPEVDTQAGDECGEIKDDEPAPESDTAIAAVPSVPVGGSVRKVTLYYAQYAPCVDQQIDNHATITKHCYLPYMALNKKYSSTGVQFGVPSGWQTTADIRITAI